MKKVLLVACCCMFAFSHAMAWEKDFADNPSVEADRNRDNLPDGWRSRAFRSPARLEWDKSVAHSGKASLRISDSANPGAKEWQDRTGRWVLGSRKEVTPGETYTLAVWMKTQDATGSASACIAWFADHKWLKEDHTERVSGTTDWTLFSVSGKAPAGAKWGSIFLCLSDSKGSVWFDDIHMARGDSFPRNFAFVDISGACNTGFADDAAGDGKGGWTDQGKNDMRNIPPGEMNLRGIPFRIIDPVQTNERSCIVLKGKGRETFPESVTIPINRKCETIYFLHGCAWGRKGAKVADYEFVYDDGSTARVPLRKGREVSDWWGCRDTKESAVGWEGSNAESNSVGLTIFPVPNPKPAQKIKEIRFVSAGKGVPILVAITTADGPGVLTDLPIWYEFTDTSNWYEFTFPLDDTNLDSIDLTRFLDAPAGKHGFLTVREDGHFYFADGTRGRFFGTNIGGYRCFMEKEDAEKLAARLAKYGVNMLRIHAIDSKWGKFIDYSKGDSRHFLADQFDRLDYLFAQLKKRGIYVYFDMLDYRMFQDGDGVKDASKFVHGWKNGIKGATIFNDRLIALQKEFAEKFFTHYNPYTKLKYIDDPAVAVVETTNENSVFYFRNTQLTLPCYVEELKQRWNKWLVEKYGNREALAKAWTNAKGECALLPDEDPARSTVVLPMKYLYEAPDEAPYVGERSPVRVSAMKRYFFDLERRYYGEMRAHLKKIGIKVPITGTNQTFDPASNYADAVNDFMSRNNYWRHPNVHAKPFFTFRNKAVVRSDLPRTSNPMTNVASSTVVGKPMIVPEFNWPWPIEYRAECLPMMAAYACLQDWDGLLFFSYGCGFEKIQMFCNRSDPVRWGEFPAAALMFHRNDVSVAKNTINVGYTESDIFTSRPSHREVKFSPFRHLTYISKVRNVYLAKAYEDNAQPLWDETVFEETLKKRGLSRFTDMDKKHVSDTGELCMDSGRQIFTIATPRTKAAIGFLGQAGKIDLAGATIECKTSFAAVMVTSYDGKPIEQSKRLLLTVVGRAENTGQAFSKNRSTVPERGKLPVIVEPVDCDLRIKASGPATLYPLDETGKRRGPVPARFEGGVLFVNTKDIKSPWCEVVME